MGDSHGTGIEVPIEVEKRMHIYYIRNRGFGNRFNVLGDDVDNHGTPNDLTQWPRNQEGMWLIQWSFWTVHQTDILWHQTNYAWTAKQSLINLSLNLGLLLQIYNLSQRDVLIIALEILNRNLKFYLGCIPSNYAILPLLSNHS